MLAPIQPCSLLVSAWGQQYPADAGSILQGAAVIPVCTAIPQEPSQRTAGCFSSLLSQKAWQEHTEGFKTYVGCMLGFVFEKSR